MPWLVETQADLNVRGVLSDTYEVYKSLFVLTFAAGLVVFGTAEFFQAFVSSGHGGLVGLLIVLALSLTGTALMQGAFVEVVRAAHDGERGPSLQDLYGRSSSRLGALIGVSLLASAGITFGLLFLIVPGVVLATRWALAVPVVMLEGASPRAALARSRELVSGHAWAVFRILFNVGLIVVIVELGFSLLGGHPQSGLLRFWLAGTIGSALMTPYMSHALTVLYYRLADPGEPLIPDEPRSWESVWAEHDRSREN